MAALNRDNLPIEQSRVSPILLGRLIYRISDQSISGTIAKDIFSDLWDNGGDVDQIIEARGLKQISDSAELEQVVEEILSKFSEQADQVRQGQGKVLGFLVGQVMKETGGKANPKAVNEILSRKLSP